MVSPSISVVVSTGSPLGKRVIFFVTYMVKGLLVFIWKRFWWSTHHILFYVDFVYPSLGCMRQKFIFLWHCDFCERFIQNARRCDGDDFWLRCVCCKNVDIYEVQQLVILFLIIFVDFKFGDINSCHLDL